MELDSPYATAILLAAGASTRMGRGTRGERKPFFLLEGKTLVEHALATFAGAPCVRQILLVAHAEDLETMTALARTAALPARCVVGGRERTDSVACAMEHVEDASSVVLIHDVARPLVRTGQVTEVAEAALEHGGALLAGRVSDTIKMSADGKQAVSTLDRSKLWAAQTPQGFRRVAFAEALATAREQGVGATDDAALYERYVGPVELVESGPDNIKLTVPADLAIAEALLRQRGATS